MKTYALIGAAGYIAPRHMQAIKDTGGTLLAALDKNDSVGIIDRYFPDASFFTEFEIFDRHLEKIKRKGTHIDYLVVCSPNYLHDAHIRFGLRHGADVICEKPLVLNPWNIEALMDAEKETGKTIYTILQLRLHPTIIELKNNIDKSKIHEVELTYITPRGQWYHSSWKGNVSKSGGIATNIGIHFFDMLIWLFGGVQQVILQKLTDDTAAGYLKLERANVKWFLSIDNSSKPIRSIIIDNEKVEFTDGFTELHTKSYQEILNNNGFKTSEIIPATKLVHTIRNMKSI